VWEPGGSWPGRGSGSLAQRIIASSRPVSVLMTGAGKSGNTPVIGRQVADIAVDHAEQCDDRGLVGGDAIEVAHGRQAKPNCC
jgi:hypothetical protein